MHHNLLLHCQISSWKQTASPDRKIMVESITSLSSTLGKARIDNIFLYNETCSGFAGIIIT